MDGWAATNAVDDKGSNMSANSLHRVRLILNQRAVLQRLRNSRATHDSGYLLHAALSELFAVNSQKADVPLLTFAEDDTVADEMRQMYPESLFVHAYSTSDERALLAAMGPLRQSFVQAVGTLPMPPTCAGDTFAFRTHVCPVRRIRAAGDHAHHNKNGRAVSREVDAWLAERLKQWPPALPTALTSFERAGLEWLDRKRVYTTWLGEQLARAGAATLMGEVEMVRFARARLYRKGERPTDSGHGLERPCVVLAGGLRVNDACAFDALLRRGVGRHRAFGFGMLRISQRRGT
jgi:CRISPR system Cascade subunit CasE